MLHKVVNSLKVGFACTGTGFNKALPTQRHTHWIKRLHDRPPVLIQQLAITAARSIL